MRNIKKSTKRTAIVGGTVAALIGGGVAFAAWTSTGTGHGTAAAATAIALDVNVGSVSNLFPTSYVDVPFTVKNTNPYQITLSSAVPSHIAVDSAHTACGVESITADTVTLGDVIEPGASSSSHMVRVHMSNGAIDACQDATFTFDLTANGKSSGTNH
jgi:hypothetical protein